MSLFPDQTSLSSPDRSESIRLLIADVLCRRAHGTPLKDIEVIDAHPELMPELAGELRAVAEIHRARLAAQAAGRLRDSLEPLSDSQLEMPIELAPDEADQAAALGVIDGYIIQNEIGSGAQGTVFKAVQESTGRQVALKVFAGGALAGSRARTRFNRESHILASLDHPNIVGILDRGRMPDGTFYLVMPFVEGRPLDETADLWARKGAEGSRQLLRLFVKVAGAVQSAHQRGVVHRDLKPSNILIDQWGEPHVLDFGMAKLTRADSDEDHRRITMTGQVLGSLPWASPEQASGQSGDVDARTDVYALGIMLYRSLTGEFPYDVAGSVTDVIRSIRCVEPRPPSRTLRSSMAIRFGAIPPALDAIVLKALVKNPPERYASAGDLAGDLERYLSGRRALAYTLQLGSGRQRRRLGVAVLLLACLAGVRAWQLHKSQPQHSKPTVHVADLPTEVNSIHIKMVQIPAGHYMMGSPPDEPGRSMDEWQHNAVIPKPFWMATTAVTCGQYKAVTGSLPALAQGRSDDFPVTFVSWYDVTEFCQKLSKIEGQSYRLPTETEWEYACRAGTTDAYAGTGNLADLGWYGANSGDSLHAVGGKLPNNWGLYDMHGDEAEWCADDYNQSYHLFPDLPGDKGSQVPLLRVIRGGGFNEEASGCRCARRQAFDPNSAMVWLGFRIVRDDRPPSPPVEKGK